MTDAAAPAPHAAVPPPPRRKLRLPPGTRGRLALAALAVLLVLAELAVPTHTPFEGLSFFLFHPLFIAAVAVVLIALTQVTDRVLARPGDSP